MLAGGAWRGDWKVPQVTCVGNMIQSSLLCNCSGLHTTSELFSISESCGETCHLLQISRYETWNLLDLNNTKIILAEEQHRGMSGVRQAGLI